MMYLMIRLTLVSSESDLPRFIFPVLTCTISLTSFRCIARLHLLNASSSRHIGCDRHSARSVTRASIVHDKVPSAALKDQLCLSG